MALFELQLTQFPSDNLERLPAILEGEVGIALKLTFRDGSFVFVLSHTELIAGLPGGAVHLNCQVASVPDIYRQCGILTGKAEISKLDYSIADLNHELQNHIADKDSNGQGTLGVLVQDYEIPLAEPFDEKWLVATSTLLDDSYQNGYTMLECSDIQRGTDVTIWQKKTWRLAQSITASADMIPTNIPEGSIADFDYFFQHSERYDQDPNEATIAYAKIEDTGEIYSYTSRTAVDGVVYDVVKDRGVLGTLNLVADVTIEDDTEEKNWPIIREIPHIQGEATDVVQALITGETYTGETLPEHWSGSVPKTFVHYPSFAAAAEGFTLKFTDPGQQNLKKFYESECLIPRLAVLDVNRAGQLTWKTTEKPRADGPYIAHFSTVLGNIVSRPGRFRKIVSKIRNPVSISYGYSHVSKEFRSPVIYDNAIAMAKNPVTQAIEFAFRGIHPGIHTESQIYKLAGVAGDQYFHPTGAGELVVRPEERGHDLGSVARVEIPEIPDVLSSGTVQTMDRNMMIVSSRYNRRSRATTYGLSYAGEVSTSLFEGNAIANLPVEEYKRDGVDITTVAGVTNNNGVLSGTPTLSLNQKYYYVNDANLGDGCQFDIGWDPTYTGFGPFLEFWCYGPWICAAIVDLTGLGLHAGGAGGIDPNTPAEPGEAGYFGTSLAGGSMLRMPEYRDYSLSDNNNDYRIWTEKLLAIEPIAQPPGKVRSVPDLTIAVNDGKLEGWPADQSGSGGCGVNYHTVDDINWNDSGGGWTIDPIQTYLPGASGVRGGAGFKLISQGGGFTGAGRVITDGAPSPAAIAASGGAGDWYNVQLSRPGPAQPGVFLWGLDGDHLEPVVDGNTFHAFNGDSTMPGEPLPAGWSTKRSDSGQVHAHLLPQAYRNMWADAFRLVRIPADEAVQAEPLNEVEEALVRAGGTGELLRYTGSLPSNFNVGDYAIEQSLADGIDPMPVMHYRGANDWILVDWVTGDTTAALLLGNYRITGKTAIYYQATRPAEGTYSPGELWYSSKSKVMWRLGPPDEWLNKFEHGFYTGPNLLSDGQFTRYVSSPVEDTIIASTNRDLNPTVEVAAESPGQTSDDYLLLNTGDYTYNLAGAVDWTENGTSAISVAAGGSGDGRFFMQASEGMQSASANRQIWLYVKSANSGVDVKVQSAGNTAGDSAIQASHTVQNTGTEYAWEQMTGGATNGLFLAFASELQVYTDTAGVDIAAIILLDVNSQSTPAGEAGFAGSPVGGKPFFPWYITEPTDRNNPIPGVNIGNYGENGSIGVRLTGQGSGNYVLFREGELIPVSNNRRLIVRSRVHSELTVQNVANQGYAVDIRAFDANGNLVLDNDLENAGTEAWYSADDSASGWFWHTEVFDTGPSQKVQYVSIAPQCHADSGTHVDISEVVVEMLPVKYYQLRDATFDFIDAYGGGINNLQCFAWDVEVPWGAKIRATMDCSVSTDTGNARVQGFTLAARNVSSGIGPQIFNIYQDGIALFDVTATDFKVSATSEIVNTVRRDLDQIRLLINALDGAPAPNGDDLYVRDLNITIEVHESVEAGWG